MRENKEGTYSIAMEIDTQETFLLYWCSPQPRILLQNPPSQKKISFQFTRQRFKFIFDEPQDFLYRIREEVEFPSVELCISVDSKEANEDNGDFYLSVYESLERIGIQDEGLHGLATSIVENASEVKQSENSSNPGFKDMLLKVSIIEADVVTTSNPSTETENAIRESMEEFEEANYGMVPTSEKEKKRMLTSMIITGKENSPVKYGWDGRERKRRRRESNKEEKCTICMEDIGVGSYVAQAPCRHVFHRRCIKKWLGVSHFCPTSRFEFPAALSHNRRSSS